MSELKLGPPKRPNFKIGTSPNVAGVSSCNAVDSRHRNRAFQAAMSQTGAMRVKLEQNTAAPRSSVLCDFVDN